MGFNMKGSQSTIADSFPSFLAQEELLAKVIEFFPYPIQVYTPDGTSLLVNTAMLTEYHAISPEQVVGKYNVLKDPAVLASSQLPILKQAFQGKTVFFTGIIISVEDVTERHQAQEKLQEAHRQLEQIIEHLPDAAIVINKLGQVLFWNREMEKLTGIPQEQMIGKGKFEYALPLYGERRPVLIDLALAQDKPDYSRLKRNYDFIRQEQDLLIAEIYVPLVQMV